MKSLFSILVIFFVAVLPFAAQASNSTSELRHEFVKKQISLYLNQHYGLTLIPNSIDIQADNNIVHGIMIDVSNVVGLVKSGLRNPRSVAGYLVYFQAQDSKGTTYNAQGSLAVLSPSFFRIFNLDYCSQTIVSENSPYYCMSRHSLDFEKAE